MSEHHEVTLKPINEVAEYKRNLIPMNIPNDYTLKSIFNNIASDENIRNGVIAFRNFLLSFFDRLIADGHIYAIPPKKPSSMSDYPFLNNISNLMVDIGYYGKLSINGDSLIINELPSCSASIDANGKKKSPKITFASQIECFRFLALCGFDFNGIDLDGKSLNISEYQPLIVSYPQNSILLIGLKVLSIADMELRLERRYWNDHNLLRCDYTLITAEPVDITDVLKNFLFTLPDDIKEFALELHQRYIDFGLTCTISILDDVSFSYALIDKRNLSLSSRDKYQKRIWAFSYSMRNGYCLFVRAKKTDKYTDVIKEFPLFLQEKIAQGYGCYRKMGRERCLGDCQGIRFALDDSVLGLRNDIITWLDNEMPSSLRK